MAQITRIFSLVTCGFPHGAYQSQNHNKPELRVPSIRGHLRWWYDALFSVGNNPGSRSSDTLFGNIGNHAQASKLIVRVEAIDEKNHVNQAFIPHKGARGGQKNAIAPGSSYQLTIIPRRGGITEGEQQKLERSIDAWLLLGAIGQRANRAAGSVWPSKNAPEAADDYTSRCKELLVDSKLSFAVLSGTFDDELAVRRVAGDFLADKAFQHCGKPFGSARPRKPSNLKLKAVNLDGALRLVAVWDSRSQRTDDLNQGIGILAQTKEIGQRLAEVKDQF